MTNVLLDIPDDIIKTLDEHVIAAKLARVSTPGATEEQLRHAQALSRDRGVSVANMYLREVQKRQPAPSRRKLLMQLIEVGFRHMDEVNNFQPTGLPSPEVLFPTRAQERSARVAEPKPTVQPSAAPPSTKPRPRIKTKAAV